MSKAQLVITAVVLEGRSKSQVARDYDLSRQWVHQLWSPAIRSRELWHSSLALAARTPMHTL
jgi:hypothetical protein